MKYLPILLCLFLISCETVTPDHEIGSIHPYSKPLDGAQAIITGQYWKGSFLSNRAVVMKAINGTSVFDPNIPEDAMYYVPPGMTLVSYYYHHTREQAHIDLTFEALEGQTYEVKAELLEDRTVNMWIENTQTKESVSDVANLTLEPTNKPRLIPLHPI